MTSQTLDLNHRSDGVQREQCQWTSSDCLYAEARTGSGDLAPRSHAPVQESICPEPEQQGQARRKKRKHSYDEQQRRVKRHCRPVAQPAPLTASELKSVQDEQYNLLRLYQAIGVEDEFYDKAWVLALDTNGEMWRLRCHWVSRGGYECDTYYSKVLRCWAVEDPRDAVISEARASMRNVVDWMRKVLFKDLHTAVDTYDNTYKARSETEDASIPLGSDHSCADETQSVGFGTQPNAAFNSQEVLETDTESIHECIESAT